MRLLLTLFVLPSLAFAQTNGSGAQGFQPSPGNHQARVGGLLGFYFYGWPAGGDVEPDVKMQLLFDEESGNVVDEVTGHSFTKIVSNQDEFTYNINPGGVYSSLQPGINMSQVGTICDRFKSTTVPASMDIGANDDLVYEAWASLEAVQATTVSYLFGHGGAQEGRTTYFYAYHQPGTPRFVFRMTTDDATNSIVSFTTDDMRDDAFHKYRFALDRDVGVEFFIDGVSKGSASMAAVNGKALEMSSMRFFSAYNDVNCWRGTYLEHRLTVGNATNDSGEVE